MDRRSFLHTSGALLGGLTLGGLISSSYAGEPARLAPGVPDAAHPLLLNFNENSLGMSPKARQAVVECLGSAFRYPDAARAALISRLGSHYRLDDKHITLGNGSSETIQATVQMLAAQGQRLGKPVQLVTPDPTFNYAELYAQPLGVSIAKVPLTAALAFDLPAMRTRANDFNGLSIVYLCNPNNPTATLTPSAEIARWVNEAPADVFFIVDEAYAELVIDPEFRSAIELVAAGRSNLLVTRTFSKIYALAGLRIGYGVATPDVIAKVEPFVSLDNTNAAGAVAALASLDDKAFITLSRQSINLSRKLVSEALDSLNIRYLPSQANFIFHQVKGDVAIYQKRMAEHHVMVGREFPPATGWSRLTLGTPQEMQQFVTVLKQFRKQGWI